MQSIISLILMNFPAGLGVHACVHVFDTAPHPWFYEIIIAESTNSFIYWT